MNVLSEIDSERASMLTAFHARAAGAFFNLRLGLVLVSFCLCACLDLSYLFLVFFSCVRVWGEGMCTALAREHGVDITFASDSFPRFAGVDESTDSAASDDHHGTQKRSMPVWDWCMYCFRSWWVGVVEFCVFI
jgi:hypothetical protein